ncbi:response regulator transcription factor [Streptomyces fuscichromogenes]|uniref:DNA-binding response regulator n=1 Tax=Streptomyces fuscichromogenes TaxID=1324013 RepID=A0A917XN67_9ACTN|nr:response regulator transcription factor [Streptomyces fuscichromogenes]GGN40411.1 DNA-binding response regulator [Streptomyces fuscichromogenes]
MTIRILLADDQSLLRASFRVLIDATPGMSVIGEAANGQEAIELTRAHRPDVVLMDIRMPGTDGLAATTVICADPDLAEVRVLILTTFENDEYVAQALRAGASGFLGKGATPETLLGGIKIVAAGDSLLSPTATRALITRYLAAPDPSSAVSVEGIDTLTQREREIVALVGTGRSNVEIAEMLVVSPLTVRSHIQRAMGKLHARDRAQLVVIAYQSGLTTVGPRP